MIRIALISKHYQRFAPMISHFFDSQEIDYTLSNYRHQSIQDIYFIEIEKKQDLSIIEHLSRLDSTLIYIIGPRDFDLVRYCLSLATHLYFAGDQIELDLQKYCALIMKQIQHNFQYYIYQNKGMISKIRLSQIYYVESLRHMLIIHSINGQLCQRKPLNAFLNEIENDDFIQIHKSYAVNKKQIKIIKSHQLILKNETVLPIGRNYKNNLKNKQDIYS